MSGVFIIRNQLGHYWGKSGSWVKGGRPGQVASWTHRDEAVNTLFELGSQHTDLRGEVMLAETEDQLPKNLEISQHPVPKPDKGDVLENNEEDPIDD
ncbi:MAG: hypothetical protein H2070_01470 [Congregibacter sp.]|nr:hypothetical protein [Congregibacter sp.]